MSRILVSLMFVVVANGQIWVEQRTLISGGEVTPRIDGLLTRSLTRELGGFAWFQTQKGYSQAYGGMTFSPKSWFQLAAGLGQEEWNVLAGKGKSSIRVGSYLWAGNKHTSLLVIGEYGGSGAFYKAEFNRQICAEIGFGVITERFNGTGPRVEVGIPRTPLKIRFSPLLNSGKVRGLIGVRWYL